MTAKIPAVPDYRTADAGLGNWVLAVNSAFKALRDANLMTQEDINDLARKAKASLSTKRAADAQDVTVDVGGGLVGAIPIADLVSKLMNNQTFKDAIAKTLVGDSSTGGAAPSSVIYTLEQAAQAAQRTADAAAKTASDAVANLERIKQSRGPISSVGVDTAWTDLVAGRCIFWMQLNGGTGGAPTWPTNIEPYLVIGDRVTLRNSASPVTWMETKQYLGPKVGWISTPNSVDFNDVVNLAGFATNVNTVIDSSLMLVKTTPVAGANLKPGAGGTVTNPTLAQIVNEFDYTTAGTQAYNTLQALIAIEARLTAHGI